MNHEYFMKRAIALAESGLGTASPNPTVGAVLVHKDRIIGEGWHVRPGEEHAEVRCFDSVAEVDKALIPESTLYVTLEPCNHTGRTPPCSLRIIEEGVKKVVVAVEDPHPAVGGKGLERLRAAGVDVVMGVEAPAARWMNRRFLTALEKGRPYVILKWAQSSDGYMDPGKGAADRGPVWITGPRTKQWVHRWRSEEDAILIGYRTALVDNPRLDVREWAGTNPLRLVIDLESDLPKNLHLWHLEGETWTFGHQSKHPYSDRHFEIDWDERSVDRILEHLQVAEIRSVIVEGGAQTLDYFISRELWDEARILTGSTPLCGGLEAPVVSGTQLEEHFIDQDRLNVILHDT